MEFVVACGFVCCNLLTVGCVKSVPVVSQAEGQLLCMLINSKVKHQVVSSWVQKPFGKEAALNLRIGADRYLPNWRTKFQASNLFQSTNALDPADRVWLF